MKRPDTMNNPWTVAIFIDDPRNASRPGLRLSASASGSNSPGDHQIQLPMFGESGSTFWGQESGAKLSISG